MICQPCLPDRKQGFLFAYETLNRKSDNEMQSTVSCLRNRDSFICTYRGTG